MGKGHSKPASRKNPEKSDSASRNLEPNVAGPVKATAAVRGAASKGTCVARGGGRTLVLLKGIRAREGKKVGFDRSRNLFWGAMEGEHFRIVSVHSKEKEWGDTPRTKSVR